MFHMKRSCVHFAVALIWLFVISSCVIAVIVDKATNRFTTYTSTRMAFGYRVLLLLESAIILALYSCLALQVLKRKSELLKMNAHTASWKKERATLVVCLLVSAYVISCLYNTVCSHHVQEKVVHGGEFGSSLKFTYQSIYIFL